MNNAKCKGDDCGVGEREYVGFAEIKNNSIRGDILTERIF